MKKLSKIRAAAKGQDCTLRVSGVEKCYPADTTVLCHAPCRDDGKGYKSPDFWAAFGCFSCAAIIDRHQKVSAWRGVVNINVQRYLPQSEIDAAWLRGIYETQKILREMGLIK